MSTHTTDTCISICAGTFSPQRSIRASTNVWNVWCRLFSVLSEKRDIVDWQLSAVSLFSLPLSPSLFPPSWLKEALETHCLPLNASATDSSGWEMCQTVWMFRDQTKRPFCRAVTASSLFWDLGLCVTEAFHNCFSLCPSLPLSHCHSYFHSFPVLLSLCISTFHPHLLTQSN